MIYVHLAEGFEEVEALTIVDVLRRAGEDAKTVSITGERQVTGMNEGNPEVVEKVIGDTVYIIENAVSEDARETAYEKVRRLILHDTDIYQKKAS